MRRGSGEDGASPQADSRRLGGGAIASIIGAGLLVIFMLQNADKVRLDFLFWSFTWPVWLLTIVSAVLGAFVWFGLGSSAGTGAANSADTTGETERPVRASAASLDA